MYGKNVLKFLLSGAAVFVSNLPLSALAETLEHHAHVEAVMQSPPYVGGNAILNDLQQPLMIEGQIRKGQRLRDPIAVKLYKCARKHEYTNWMNGCIATAYMSYDKLLSEIYQLTLKENKQGASGALKESQQEWELSQEKEAMAQSAYEKYPSFNSSDRPVFLSVAVGYQRIAAIRARIAALMFYLGAGHD